MLRRNTPKPKRSLQEFRIVDGAITYPRLASHGCQAEANEKDADVPTYCAPKEKDRSYYISVLRHAAVVADAAAAALPALLQNGAEVPLQRQLKKSFLAEEMDMIWFSTLDDISLEAYGDGGEASDSPASLDPSGTTKSSFDWHALYKLGKLVKPFEAPAPFVEAIDLLEAV